MTQAEVRQMFIKANPGTRMTVSGLDGYWYRCMHCGKLCGRPGNTGSRIPDNMKMEVDHKIPWSKALGGGDVLSNLQPLCKPCNRNKSNNQSLTDTASALIGATAQGEIGSLLGGMAVAKVAHSLGIKPRRK